MEAHFYNTCFASAAQPRRTSRHTWHKPWEDSRTRKVTLGWRPLLGAHFTEHLT